MKRVKILALLLAACASFGASPAETRPNLVVIMADDLDPRTLQTALGAGLLPHFEATFARGGVQFPNCFATNPICAPSRATFLTGRYSHNHGVHHNGGVGSGGVTAMDHTSTIAIWLKTAGYRTGHVGKFLNGYGSSTPATWVPPGWDDWQGLVDPTTYSVYNYKINDNGFVVSYGEAEQDYQTDVLAKGALRFIDRADRWVDGKPFFLVVTPLAPHVEVHGGSWEDVWSWTIRPAPRHLGTTESFPLPQPPSFNEADVSDKPLWLQNRPLLTAENVAALTRKYRDRLAALRAVDDLIGTVVDALRRTGELDRTVLLFTADNGYLYGEHRLPEKMYAYEESVRLPLYVRAPGLAGGRSFPHIVLNNDLAPTLADLGNATPTHAVDGRSFVPVLGGAAPWRERFLIEHWMGTTTKTEAPTYSAVRTGTAAARIPDRLYVEYRAGEWGAKEFYDRTLDPYEMESRHADPATAADREALKEALNKLVLSWGAWSRAAED